MVDTIKIPSFAYLVNARTGVCAAQHELAKRELEQLPKIESVDESITYDGYFAFWEQQLRFFDRATAQHLSVDFLSGPLRYRQQQANRRNEPLAKAVGLKHGLTPRVADLSAGLGRDSFLLASLGCQVTLVERSPLVAALLGDGIVRARQDRTVGALLEGHFSLTVMDSSDWLTSPGINTKPDVIYLDPMFPPKKKSALVKKDMQLLQKLLAGSSDDPDLLSKVIASGCPRVVVKRPDYAPELEGIKADAQIKSKKHRFDIYLSTSHSR